MNSKRQRPSDYGDALEKYGYRGVYSSDATFLGVRRIDLRDASSFRGADVVILGAPFDGGTSHRPGTRFAPQAIRRADYLPAVPYRPHLDLGVDPFSELEVVDAGDVPMPPGEMEKALKLLEDSVASISAAGAIPLVLGGDHTIALPDMAGVSRHRGALAVIHFDAHADTGEESDFGSKYGHGTPMRRAIERGAVRGDQFIQVGLRGYWPGPLTLKWAKETGIRSYTMNEVVLRGLDECLSEAFDRI
jgi:arginase family enzyme